MVAWVDWVSQKLRSGVHGVMLAVVPAGPEQLAMTVTSAPAPLATRVAGELTWISSVIGCEDCPTAGPAGPTKAATAPATATARPARTTLTLTGNIFNSQFSWDIARRAGRPLADSDEGRRN